MPTYGYQCTHCNHQMDAFQKITDDPLTQCPQCKKSTLKREIGGGSASFQFTGNGFYLTDYKKSKDPKSSCCPCGKKESCSD